MVLSMLHLEEYRRHPYRCPVCSCNSSLIHSGHLAQACSIHYMLIQDRLLRILLHLVLDQSVSTTSNGLHFGELRYSGWLCTCQKIQRVDQDDSLAWNCIVVSKTVLLFDDNMLFCCDCKYHQSILPGSVLLTSILQDILIYQVLAVIL